MAYWLMKSEPHVFSIDQLKAKKRQSWDGVRNYQARNMMRDDMKKGDLAFFYHSNCKEPGVAGTMTVCKESYPDNITFGRKGKKVKANADPDNPTWFMVDVQYKRKLKRTILLSEIKAEPALADMALVRKGNRLSVMPVSKEQWDYILGME
jgi:predicted RNA-binding protein with PUA-like domain